METLEVTAAIIMNGEKVLIARRPPGGRHPGRWEFPGGKIETGETPEECLEREIREELGATISVGEMISRNVHTDSEIRIELLAYRCEIISGDLENIGCDMHKWVFPQELAEYDLLEPDQELVFSILKSANGRS